MAVQWVNVFSSNINRVGYDDDGGVLLVECGTSGKTSAYGPGVPPELFDTVTKNWSVTEAINSEVKPNYGHKYV